MNQQYTAEDMASAAAQGFRDGQASLKPVLEQALEALDSCDAAHPSDGGRQWYNSNAVDAASEALHAALKEMRE